METVNHYFQIVLNFVNDGYHQLSEHTWLALIVALFATAVMKGWGQLLPLAIAAAIVQNLFLFLAPMLMGHGGSPQLPEFATKEFWIGLAQLAVGYALLIAVFFFLKKMFFRGGATAAKAH